MRKISYSELKQSMTMFFVNSNVDKEYIEKRKNKVRSLITQMSNIDNREGLKEYIKTNNDSLENLLIILGVSTEYFKRVISLFRIQKGLDFQTEWSVNAVWKQALEHDAWMNKLCNLFLDGFNDKEIYQYIPAYRLKDLQINNSVLCRLKNEDFLDFLVRKDFDTSYNSELSSINVEKLEKILNDLKQVNHLDIKKNENVNPTLDNTRDIQVNYAIRKAGDKLPCFYIKYSFILTTSKGQSDFTRSVKDIRDFIKNSNSEAKQIVLVDGAGWIGRQSDLKQVWDYSDFCLNLNHINDLYDIIEK